MSKFKVGDRVVVAHLYCDHEHHCFPLGFEFVVRDTDSSGVYAANAGGYVFDSRLELVGSIKTPHKHAALIKAWADDTSLKLQCRRLGEDEDEWCDMENPSWSRYYDYRIKPEPKPDWIRYGRVAFHRDVDMHTFQLEHDNVKFTFDGETGKLKSVSLI